jgi:hypothetical protein
MAETSDRWRDPNRREYTVRVSLGKNDAGLRPSMRCDATITMGHVEDSLTVPLQAVFASEQLRFVYVPKDGKYRRIPVKIGQRSDTYVQVLAGIEPGDRVLLREPAAGEILPEPWDPAALKVVGFQLDDSGSPVAIKTDDPGPGKSRGPRREAGAKPKGSESKDAPSPRETAEADTPATPAGARPEETVAATPGPTTGK